jgi:flavin reductase (DIM6/NTAB) family NADH-FMN oxidoreductase RutF
MLVSWVQQAAFDPPSVTVAIKHGRPAGPMIDGSKRFTLNVIGEDPSAMFKHFGKGFAPEDDAFKGLKIEPTEFGPLLLDCIAQLGCEVTQKVNVGDHDLSVAIVAAGRGTPGAKPYLHTRKSGLSY